MTSESGKRWGPAVVHTELAGSPYALISIESLHQTWEDQFFISRDVVAPILCSSHEKIVGMDGGSIKMATGRKSRGKELETLLAKVTEKISG